MAAFFRSSAERAFVRAVSRIVYCNPFLEERVALEREALGAEYVHVDRVWSAGAGAPAQNPNAVRIGERAWVLACTLRGRRERGARPTPAERRLYEELVLYALYVRHDQSLHRVLLELSAPDASRVRVDVYDAFAAELDALLGPERSEPAWQAPHLFAVCFQIRCAFDRVHRHLVGGSLPTARLRAAVWQSIFTHDMGRYVRSLHERMADLATLVIGPSGTGKELVARAIGLSRYLPFDPRSRTFADVFERLFEELSLSALSPTLVESELFGHRKGAFTGALEDRAGWLEACRPLGTVFLDEIGELEPGLQVKLLRVLQNRTFSRLGETRSRTFHGKVVAATNRDLAVEVRAGRFREDLYYRLCSDLVVVPSLRERLEESAADELPRLLGVLAARLVGEAEASALAAEAADWIERNLGLDYAWPGNVRELEQCLRNLLVRGHYRPLAASRPAPSDPAERLAEAVRRGDLGASELLGRYCALVHERTGSYQAAARQLGLDRRTVKLHVERYPSELRRGTQGR